VSFDDPVEEVKVDDIDVMQEFEASDDEDPLHVSKELRLLTNESNSHMSQSELSSQLASARQQIQELTSKLNQKQERTSILSKGSDDQIEKEDCHILQHIKGTLI
jgi:hypothetical protein